MEGQDGSESGERDEDHAHRERAADLLGKFPSGCKQAPHLLPLVITRWLLSQHGAPPVAGPLDPDLILVPSSVTARFKTTAQPEAITSGCSAVLKRGLFAEGECLNDASTKPSPGPRVPGAVGS